MFKLVEKSFQIVPLCSSNTSLTYGSIVKEIKYRKITLALILMLVILPTSVLYAQVPVETTDSEPFNQAILNMIKAQAMTRKQEMLNLFGEGPYSPDVENCMQNAQQAMEQAQNFEETNPKAASEQYIRALKQYRNAYRKYFEEHPEYIDEIVDTVSAGDEIETTPTQEALASAKEELINRFQERHQDQIRVMIENVEELKDDLSAQDAEKARQALMHTLEKSYRIQERIQNREFDEALDEFDEAIDSLDEGLDELEDETAGLMLKSMNKLESRIQKMLQNRARKAAYGGDTSIEDEGLEQLNGNKNKMKHDYSKNKGAGKGSNGNQGTQGNGGS
jgi:hypothetical protein